MENAYRKFRIEALKFIFWGLCSQGLYINNSSQEELIFVSKTHLVFERDQATSLKSTVIIVIVIIIIIIIIIIISVQFIRPYFFSKGLVQTLNLGHLRVSLSLLSLDG